MSRVTPVLAFDVAFRNVRKLRHLLEHFSDNGAIDQQHAAADIFPLLETINDFLLAV
jgi:hypothetical protein